MLTKITNFFNRINNRFTYRQRFIFFSFVFILTTPFPGYWLIKIENFFIERTQWQMVGNEYQDLINTLILDLSNHRLAIQNEKDSEIGDQIQIYQENVNQKFQKLENLDVTNRFIFIPTLGSGFSDPPKQKLTIEKAHSLWREVLQISLTQNKHFLDAAHANLIDHLLDLLLQVEDAFELTIPPTLIQKDLIQSTIVLLPTAQKLITDILALRQGEQTEEKKLKELVLTQELKANLQKTNRVLERAYLNYFIYLNGKNSLLDTVRKTYTSYHSLSLDFIQKTQLSANVPASVAIQLLEINNALKKYNIEITNSLFENQLYWHNFAKTTSLIIYLFVSLLLAFYIIFRILTRHLMEICYHLRDMTKGHFKKCFCSHFNDEFGLVGRTFDKMAQAIQDVLGELKKVGCQLTESINQITKTTKSQESSAISQQEQVKDIEDTAKLIATESRVLADKMNNLNKTSLENSAANSAKEGLERMQGNMSELTEASTEIINSLNTLQEKVISAHTLIAFMGKVSDQAALLSLNAAIETANVSKHKASFIKITHEIQRFAEKTSSSTYEIKKIIQEISQSVNNVRSEAKGCLKEINEGVHRLMHVSHQLGSITHQGIEQIRKFETVNDVMQMQAIAAENIINSITHLGENATKNRNSIHQLHENIEELGRTANELQKTLGMFI